MLEYVANFTKLACFIDDYMATDMAKVRKFEDGLKLSIRGKIVEHLLQDMDSMVKTILAIEREVDDTQSIQNSGASGKRKGDRPSSFSFGKKHRTSTLQQVQGQGYNYQGQGQDRSSQGGRHFRTPS